MNPPDANPAFGPTPAEDPSGGRSGQPEILQASGGDALACLLVERCTHQSARSRLDENTLAMWLRHLPSWRVQTDCESAAGVASLVASFRFGSYHETIAFVNALAWMVHHQDHHPDLTVSYDRVTVRWSTHSAGGLTRNDLICAALTDQLFAQRTRP